MTYQDLVTVRVNCNKAIETLCESLKAAEEAYTAEHFDNSLIGYPVTIKNEFYPRIACDGIYIINKVKPCGEGLFELTIIRVDDRCNPTGMPFTIYGISISEIERVKY